jgi:hypothetical protein
MRPFDDPGPKHQHVYCDESQTSGVRYTVYGGIIIPERNVDRIDDAIRGFRSSRGMHHELKWEKVSRSRHEDFKALVDLIFAHLSEGHMAFKSVVFDSHERRYQQDRSDKDKGFYALYYQFLLHKFGRYARSNEQGLYVYIDERSTKYKLSTLHTILNHGIYKKYRRGPGIVKAVEPRVSKGCTLIQLADVLMGAIGYQCNDFHVKPDAAKHKVALAGYIAKKARLRSLKDETPYGQQDFEIWRFRSKAAEGRK